MPALVLGLSACTDWLDVKPTTSIVAEDMWKDQSDVEAVVASCYNAMLQNDFMQRVMAWGELRSDNMIHNDNPNENAAKNIKEMYKSISLSSIVETDGICSWAPVYHVIKLCNFVIHFAPGVCDVDPDYLESEMRAHLGEARAIRALCYFYLIRTYMEVPYVDYPVLDDQQDLEVEAISGKDIIPNIIADLDFALNNAPSRYSTMASTKYRITRNAAAAMLADVYLWKASGENYPDDSISYDKVIEYCDRVFQDTISSVGAGGVASNQYLSLSTSGATAFYSFANIFGYTTSSLEPIFALFADAESMWEQNKDNLIFMNQVYFQDAISQGTRGDWRTTYKIMPNDKYPKPTDYTSKDAPFYLLTNGAVADYDARYSLNAGGPGVTWSSTSGTGFYILKFHSNSLGINYYPTWIFYRLAEIYLMKAEAIVERMNAKFDLLDDGNGGKVVKFANYPTIENDDSDEVIEKKQELQALYAAEMAKAHALVTRIYKRSNKDNTSLPLLNDYVSDEAALVYAERRREFLFEGKRWFDLMRIARRDMKRDPNNGNKALIDCVKTKLDEGADLIASRLSSEQALYWPIAKSELDRNTKLTQNPYYKSKTSDYEK